MICAVCYGVLRGHQGSQWRGTFDLHFDHQVNRLELKKSADMSCCICRSLLHELSRLEQKGRVGDGVYAWVLRIILGEWFRHNKMDFKQQKRFISAYLSEIYEPASHSFAGQRGIYRLDFKLRDSERVGTFVLQQIGQISSLCPFYLTAPESKLKDSRSNASLHTPFSKTTSSDEALVQAKKWIDKCISSEHEECPGDGSDNPWYPKRLIDLGEVITVDQKFKRKNASKVRLVLRTEAEDVRLGIIKRAEDARMLLSHTIPTKEAFYVTLSHCWGKYPFSTLTEDKIPEFQKGISLASLPRTFQDAIDFARRLSRDIRYIWIDSLCIIQGHSQAQREDWLSESAVMYEIYKNSYCNISATAATDSRKGLFFKREPHELWEDEINLNIEDIPGQVHGPSIQRCTIVDLAFWERNVHDAPVNRRGWVLQERLMAPRVLHFCEGQIAWECNHLDAAESSRDGIPNFRLKAGDIVPGDRLKSFVPHLYHKQPEQATKDPEAYHRWKKVVEVYSKTKLTNPGDKLIALSGIAKMMSDQIQDTYIAGMWNSEQYLECQLLWRVDPVYENGQFSYLSRRPKDPSGALIYRAPTFSWAAVDAERGIAYGEITNEGLKIKVTEVEVTPESPDAKNKFGLVKAGYLKLTGLLKKIEMKVFEKNGMTRYSWHLVTRANGVSKSEYTNVCLDSPSDDSDILNSDAQVYCLPARMDSSKYLICLLLKLDKSGSDEMRKYRRIGVTKIPPYESGKDKVRLQDKVLDLSGDEATYGDWDAGAEKHTVCIV